MLAHAFDMEYGTDVSMEYIELSDPETRSRHEDIVKLARRKYMRFPIVMIDGGIVCDGSLDYYCLDALISERLTGAPQTGADDSSL